MSENEETAVGPGRPFEHDPEHVVRLQKLRATDPEWAEFKRLLPSNTRQAFELLFGLLKGAAAIVDTLED